MKLAPPTRRSTCATGVVTGAGANHCFSKEGSVQQRNSLSRGASISRVRTSSLGASVMVLSDCWAGSWHKDGDGGRYPTSQQCFLHPFLACPVGGGHTWPSLGNIPEDSCSTPYFATTTRTWFGPGRKRKMMWSWVVWRWCASAWRQ